MGFDGKFFQRNFKIFFLFSEPVMLFYNSSTRHNNNTNKERKKSFDESSPRSRDIGVNKEVKPSKSGVKKEIVTVSSIFLPHDKLGFDSEGFPMINPTSFVVNTTTSNTTTTILNKTKPFITKEVINFNSSQRILFEDLTRQ